MYIRKIKYKDYNGKEREEDFYFNLSTAEIIKWLTTTGGYTLDKLIARLAREQNGREIMRIFESLIYESYGELSLDGRRFDKSEEVKRNFIETEAYSVLFTEVVTDAKKASEFVNNIIPRELAEEVEKIFKENPEGIPDEIDDYITAKVVSLP